jgi:PTS system nitrogen regulatory IIA component
LRSIERKIVAGFWRFSSGCQDAFVRACGGVLGWTKSAGCGMMKGPHVSIFRHAIAQSLSMADDDYGIESLAAYLHLAPAQVLRLADRGKLPGRKVAGQWRFAPAEVHHWLEERIGLSSDEELEHMECLLRRAAGELAEPTISIAAMLPVKAVAVPLPARTRGSVITSMVELAAATGNLWDAAKMAEAVRAREDMLPTALENGVALLHPRRPLSSILAQPFLAFGRTASPLPFGAPRGKLTDLYFLVCSMDDAGHLRVLARLSRLIGDAELLEALREAPDAEAAHQAIAQREERLSS